ncbi:hypothetical protein TNIN_381621 [Trichonephila inaurata madagascariensis]|uniref:Uncharacterized protein n=1 Tax=Trichonephila inaurata madagascariensis TaxID=2747483 RepID=A0A8X7C6J9_9ARAC|nr:hypothetical protein TNIN_381621 [Trichonephila inaurata madagascariensis]
MTPGIFSGVGTEADGDFEEKCELFGPRVNIVCSPLASDNNARGRGGQKKIIIRTELGGDGDFEKYSFVIVNRFVESMQSNKTESSLVVCQKGSYVFSHFSSNIPLCAEVYCLPEIINVCNRLDAGFFVCQRVSILCNVMFSFEFTS